MARAYAPAEPAADEWPSFRANFGPMWCAFRFVESGEEEPKGPPTKNPGPLTVGGARALRSLPGSPEPRKCPAFGFWEVFFFGLPGANLRISPLRWPGVPETRLGGLTRGLVAGGASTTSSPIGDGVPSRPRTVLGANGAGLVPSRHLAPATDAGAVYLPRKTGARALVPEPGSADRAEAGGSPSRAGGIRPRRIAAPRGHGGGHRPAKRGLSRIIRPVSDVTACAGPAHAGRRNIVRFGRRAARR